MPWVFQRSREELVDLARKAEERIAARMKIPCKHCGQPKGAHKYADYDGGDGVWVCPDKTYEPVEP